MFWSTTRPFSESTKKSYQKSYQHSRAKEGGVGMDVTGQSIKVSRSIK